MLPLLLESAIRSTDVTDSLVEVRIGSGGRWLLGRRAHDRWSPPPALRPSAKETPHGGSGSDGQKQNRSEAGPNRLV